MNEPTIPKPPDPLFDLDRALADLRLRDAAPALYAALREAVDCIDWQRHICAGHPTPAEVLARARAALRQAEGDA